MRSSLSLLLAAALVLPAAAPSASPRPHRRRRAPHRRAARVPSAVPERTPDAPLLMPEQSRLDLFDAVWGNINEGYLDPSFNGVDWAAIGDEYAPYFLQTENAWEVYDLVEEMVGLLGDDDVVFVNPLLLESLPAAETNYTGIGTLLDTRDLGSDTVHAPGAVRVPRQWRRGGRHPSARSDRLGRWRPMRDGRGGPWSRGHHGHARRSSRPASPSGTWSWSVVVSTSASCPSHRAWGPTPTSAISGRRPSMASP